MWTILRISKQNKQLRRKSCFFQKHKTSGDKAVLDSLKNNTIRNARKQK